MALKEFPRITTPDAENTERRESENESRDVAVLRLYKGFG
jgi:hypothetical protein